MFVDIHPETYQIDPEEIEKNITERTRAIMAVHYGGYPVDFDRILPLVENIIYFS